MLLLFDVDGTLVSYDGVIPQSVRDGILEARQKGHKAFIVTGRCKDHVEEPIWSIGFDGMIGGNGAYIEVNEEVIKQQSITLEEMKKIVDYLDSHNLEYYVECFDGLYGSKNFKVRGAKALEDYGMKGAKIEEVYPAMIFPESLYVKNVMKINYILESYDDYLSFKETFPQYKCSTWGGKGESAIFGDCALNNIDKQEAIKELAKYLNYNKEDIISFGDAEVDIPMFECSGISVCLGEGREKAKEAASYITKDVKDDGIYHALKHFQII